VAVKIRLMRLGKIRAPYYRIVVADSRTKRDGRVIETVGKYHPKEEPSLIEVDSERVQYWLGVGAQPSEPVAAILSKTGDWQKFKGLPAPEEPLKVAAPRVDRKAVFEAAAKESVGAAEADVAGAPKPAKKSAAKKVAAAAAPAEAPAEPPAEAASEAPAEAASEAPAEAASEAPAEAAAEVPAETPAEAAAETSGGQADATSDQPTEA
jgi:small subunit ribosomal protein S16